MSQNLAASSIPISQRGGNLPGHHSMRPRKSTGRSQQDVIPRETIPQNPAWRAAWNDLSSELAQEAAGWPWREACPSSAASNPGQPSAVASHVLGSLDSSALGSLPRPTLAGNLQPAR